MAKQFVWLWDSCYPRKGPRLEKGQLHKLADYPENAVKYWIREGAAMWEDDGSSKAKSKKEEKD